MKSFIFFPEKEIMQTPADAGLPFEELYLDTADGVKINGWFVPYPGAQTTLLWLHGNGGNISYVVGRIRRFAPGLKCNILVIDYRGYGRSGGEISEEGTYRDAQAAYDYLRARPDVDPSRIVLLGVSLGAGVATELALQRPVQGLILEAPFASIREMARIVAPYIPIGPLLTTRYDNLAKIGQVAVPLLIVHGDQDEVVPFEQGRMLFAAAREPKQFYTIPGAGHNNTDAVGGAAYFEQIAQFIATLPPASSAKGLVSENDPPSNQK
ncbi:MAG: alpha/beta hydrolase [Nitrospirae bacterium]|nr:alpha/beta hydrolase [Candidatus Manganitrophaceae bacterium]